MDLPWKFSMTPQHGPMWDLYDEDGYLVAHARRDAEGWRLRVKGVNLSSDTDPIRLGEGEPSIGFMTLMVKLHMKDEV